MAYSRIWDDTIPTGAEAANTIGQIFRNLKSDLDERIVDIFGMPSMATDPLRPYLIKFSSTPTSNDFIGGSTGGFRFRDSANANNNLTLSDAGALAIRAGLTINGTLTGVTNLTINGSISGITSLSITGTGNVINITNSVAGSNLQGLTLNSGTGSSFVYLSNTGNTTLCGIESSAGGALFAATSAYSTVLGNGAARSLHLVTNAIVRLTIDSAGAISVGGTISIGSSITCGPIVVANNGLNPYINLYDGTGNGYIQVISGSINLASRTGSHTISGSLSLTGALTLTSSTFVQGSIQKTAVAGLTLSAYTGSGYDFGIYTAAGIDVFGILPGTSNLKFNNGGGTSTFIGGLSASSYGSFSGSGSPTTGASIELKHDGTTGNILSYDRTGAAYKALVIGASSVNLSQGGLTVSGAISSLGSINILGSSGLPTATTNLWFSGGYASPTVGKIFVGDGTGWNLIFAKRVGSVDTTLYTFADNGSLTLNAGGITITTGGITLGTNGGINNGTATVSVPTSTITTVGTITTPSANSTYLIVASIDNATAGQVAVAFMIVTYSLSSNTWKATNASLSGPIDLLSMAGNQIRVDQTSGVSQNVTTTWTKLL